MDFHHDTAAIQRLARGLLPSEHDVEDVIQEAWLKALTTPPRTPENERGWLNVVAWRMAMRVAKRNARRVEGERFVAKGEALRRTPLSDLTRRETRRAISSAVEDLREPYRTALRLHYLEECTYSDMAEDLELSVASVRSQVKRGLDELRERLANRRGAFVSLGVLLVLLLPDRRRAITGAAWAGLAAAAIALVFLARPGQRAGESSAFAVQPDADEVAVRPVTSQDSARAPLQAPAALASTPEATGTDEEDRVERLRLAGVVRDPLGDPVPDAEIVVLEGEHSSVRARSDEAGRFVLDDASEKDWVWARQDGRTPSVRHAIGTIGERQREGFELALGFVVSPLRIRFESDEGAPLVGAQVRLLGAGKEAWGLQGTLESTAVDWSGQTDEDGALDTWRLSGGARISVAQAGSPALVTSFDARPGESELVVRLPRRSTLSGVVLDGSGSRVEGALVTYRGGPAGERAGRARERTWTEAAARTSTSDVDGRFHFDGLAPGPFEVLVVNAAEAMPDGSFASRVTGTLAAGDEQRIVATLDDAWSVRGLALESGAPLTGWTVVLDSKELDEFERRATVGADGSFAFHGVAGAGTLFLHAPGSGQVPHARNEALPGQAAVRLQPTEHSRPSARVSGHLAAGEGAGLAPWLELQGESLRSALRLEVSAVDGAWESPLLPPGDYVLEGVLPGTGVFDVARLTLRAGEERDLSTIQVPRARDLHVKLRWRDPIRRKVAFSLTRVSAAGTRTRKSPGIGSRLRGMALLDDGFVIRDNLPGRYDLTLRANGLDTFEGEVLIEEGFDAEVVLPDPGGFFVRMQVAAPRALEPGETRTLEVVDSAGVRTRLDPGDDKHREEVVWLGRSLAPTDCTVEVSTSGGLRGSVVLTEAGIRRAESVRIELRQEGGDPGAPVPSFVTDRKTADLEKR